MEYLASVSLKVNVPMAALLSKALPVEVFDPQSETAHPERPVYLAPLKVDLDSMRRELARIFHRGIEQRSGESVRRLDITQPNENATHRFFNDRL